MPRGGWRLLLVLALGVTLISVIINGTAVQLVRLGWSSSAPDALERGSSVSPTFSSSKARRDSLPKPEGPEATRHPLSHGAELGRFRFVATDSQGQRLQHFRDLIPSTGLATPSESGSYWLKGILHLESQAGPQWRAIDWTLHDGDTVELPFGLKFVFAEVKKMHPSLTLADARHGEAKSAVALKVDSDRREIFVPFEFNHLVTLRFRSPIPEILRDSCQIDVRRQDRRIETFMSRGELQFRRLKGRRFEVRIWGNFRIDPSLVGRAPAWSFLPGTEARVRRLLDRSFEIELPVESSTQVFEIPVVAPVGMRVRVLKSKKDPRPSPNVSVALLPFSSNSGERGLRLRPMSSRAERTDHNGLALLRAVGSREDLSLGLEVEGDSSRLQCSPIPVGVRDGEVLEVHQSSLETRIMLVDERGQPRSGLDVGIRVGPRSWNTEISRQAVLWGRNEDDGTVTLRHSARGLHRVIVCNEIENDHAGVEECLEFLLDGSASEGPQILKLPRKSRRILNFPEIHQDGVVVRALMVRDAEGAVRRIPVFAEPEGLSFWIENRMNYVPIAVQGEKYRGGGRELKVVVPVSRMRVRSSRARTRLRSKPVLEVRLDFRPI